MSSIVKGQNGSSELTKRFSDITEKATKGYTDIEPDYRILIKLCIEKKEYNIASLCYANLGQMYQRKGNFVTAISHFKKGIELGNQSVMKSGLASNMGALGTAYQEMGFSDESSDYIKKGISILEKSDDEDISKNITLGNLYSVLSFLNVSTTAKRISKADSLKYRLDLVQKALKYYQKTPQAYNKRSVGYINLASVLQDMERYDAAINALKQAFENNVRKNPRTYSRIYLGLALCHQGKQNYDSIIFYGNKFLKIGDKNDYEGQLAIYESLSEAYRETNDIELAELYDNKFLELDHKLNKNKLKSVTKEYKESSREKKELDIRVKLITYSGGFLLMLLITVIFYQRRKYKIQKKKFQNFRNGLTEVKHTADREEPKVNIKMTELIHNETEEHILKGLEEFERNSQFIKKGITLGGLATELKTNVRYLSEIIKKHKADNFTTYLNTLRINYITKKMETDPLYRKYKIGYLAELCGFATSPAFTKIFKDVTGMTPSSYLRLIEEEKRKDK
nr:AraC family transcriptional regulator [Chryseobacterium tagetis]